MRCDFYVALIERFYESVAADPIPRRMYHTIVTTLGRSGRPQSTIVRGGPYEGQMTFKVRGSSSSSKGPLVGVASKVR